MPKLYFRYGTMGSSKTMNLLMVAYNYRQNNKKIICLKPSIDTRSGYNKISSRTGHEIIADFVIKPDDNITNILIFKMIDNKIDCVLVDECQFLSCEHINQLRILSKYSTIICYGLRTDYMTNLFIGSKRLMEISDSIEEIKTSCTLCNKKATINMKKCNSIVIKKGSDNPDIGGDDKYIGVCWNCWKDS
jgi:thymidine kinase